MPRSNEQTRKHARNEKAQLRVSRTNEVRLVRVLNYRTIRQRQRWDLHLLSLYQKTRRMCREVSARRCARNTNQIVLTKSFFIEPRHAEGFGGVGTRRDAGERGSANGGRNYRHRTKRRVLARTGS